MAEDHNEYCSSELVAHIVHIEEGWTLRKSWKAPDEQAAELENRREVIEMLVRWRKHGIRVEDASGLNATIDDVIRTLQTAIRPEALPGWLVSTNSAFGGKSPLEKLLAGEVDDVYQAAAQLAWGIPT